LSASVQKVKRLPQAVHVKKSRFPLTMPEG